MKVLKPSLNIMALRSCASVLVGLVVCAGSLAAQTIQNPSFETNTFTVFPGYISGNGPIIG